MSKNGYLSSIYPKMSSFVDLHHPLVSLNNSTKRRCRKKYGMTAFFYSLWKNLGCILNILDIYKRGDNLFFVWDALNQGAFNE